MNKTLKPQLRPNPQVGPRIIFNRLTVPIAAERDGSSSGRRARFRRREAGLTLIELIGVAAVVCILALAVLSTVFRRVDQAYINREIAELNTIGNAYVQSCVRNRRIPSTNDWAAKVANQLAMPVNRVLNTARNTSRTFLVDPNLTIAGATLPYTQTTAGTASPTNARVLVASSLSGSLAATFNTLWNMADTDDIHIQRLDLGSLFHKLHLQNLDITQGWYAFDKNAPAYVATAGTRITVYVLDGTGVNLYMGGGTNILQLREIMVEDQSFVYQHGRWARNLTTPQIDTNVGEFGSVVSDFLDAGWYDPANDARPQTVIESFYNYMVGYIIWSRGDPDPGHGIIPWQGATSNSYPSYAYFKLLDDAQKTINIITGDLIK